ncbi:MAG: hypothetical protein WCH83_09550 [Alphaproteobacteria bacterium]
MDKPAETNASEIESFVKVVRDQALDLREENAKFASGWMTNLEVLTNRLSKISPMVDQLVAKLAERENALAQAIESRDDLQRKYVLVERERAVLQPRVARLDDELQETKNLLSAAHARIAQLDSDVLKASNYANELLNKVTISESLRNRSEEENAVYQQKNMEKDATINKLTRELARFTSDLEAASSELYRYEGQVTFYTERLGSYTEELDRANATISSLEAQVSNYKKDLSTLRFDTEERERRMTVDMAAKNKLIYDLEIKQSAMASKIEFLTRMNQRYREESKRQLEQVANLESSNRQLIDAFAANVESVGAVGPEPVQEQVVERPQPMLRAIGDDR